MKINEIISSVDKDEILEIFNSLFDIEYDDEKYESNRHIIIDDNGFINCFGDVSVKTNNDIHVSVLPIKFKYVKGNFNCSALRLTTLNGCPNTVEGNFSCQHNKLISLEGGPNIVNGMTYNCSHNKLTSLKGLPQSFNNEVICNNNYNLKSLEGCPKNLRNLYCYNCDIHTLINGPLHVTGYFLCYNNSLTTLDGSPKIDIVFNCNNNPIKSLKGIEIAQPKNFMFEYYRELPLLKLLYVTESITIYNKTKIPMLNDIEKILNKYTGQGRRGALGCAADLLSLGKKLGIDLTMNARW